MGDNPTGAACIRGDLKPETDILEFGEETVKAKLKKEIKFFTKLSL